VRREALHVECLVDGTESRISIKDVAYLCRKLEIEVRGVGVVRGCVVNEFDEDEEDAHVNANGNDNNNDSEDNLEDNSEEDNSEDSLGWTTGVCGTVILTGSSARENGRVLASLSAARKRINCSPSSSSNENNNILVFLSPSSALSSSVLVDFFTQEPTSPYHIPRELFFRSITRLFTSTKLAGRSPELADLFSSLENLLLTNASSLTILESRSGYGKSFLAKEFVSLVKRLGPGVEIGIVPAAEDCVNSPMHVWKVVVEEVIFRISKKVHLTPGHIEKMLPAGCEKGQAVFLNEILPPMFHFMFNRPNAPMREASHASVMSSAHGSMRSVMSARSEEMLKDEGEGEGEGEGSPPHISVARDTAAAAAAATSQQQEADNNKKAARRFKKVSVVQCAKQIKF